MGGAVRMDSTGLNLLHYYSIVHMENQGISVGSIRNSHREIHAVRRKFAPALFQELAKKLVESCSIDLVIRQHLDPERAHPILRKGGFYVLENEGRAEPGFLVFLPGKPAIYVQFRRGKNGERGWRANTLRMRVSTSVSEGGGSILIATLDDVLHRLRLEDVWMWRGNPVVGKEGFSKRREYLNEFVKHHWVPDARLLGGIFTSIAQPMSLEEFTAKKDWSMTHSVEFIPEMPGRRRMVWFLEARVKAAEAHAGLKQGRQETVIHVPSQPSPHTQTHTLTRARAVPVDRLPDVYDLLDESGTVFDRASVQQFSLSRAIREASQKSDAVWVKIEWNTEFSGYTITELEG
jgi:hypothetical protein